jgi:hypothetical protein
MPSLPPRWHGLGLRVNAAEEAGHTLIATLVHGRLSAFEHRPPEHPPAQS